MRVFTVWQPMIATDWMAPSGGVLARMADKRVQQYWDRKHVLARRMQQDARPPQPQQECCVRSGILWDLAAVYPKDALWNDKMPTAAVFNGPVVDVVDAIEAAVTGRSLRSARQLVLAAGLE
jgi:hypothetical protein